LLNLSALDAEGYVELQLSPCLVSDIVRNSISDSVINKNLKPPTLNIAHQKFHIYVNSSSVVQAICNVISNAYKYSKPGGEVFIETIVGSHNDIPMLGFQIRDNGYGMTADQLEKFLIDSIEHTRI